MCDCEHCECNCSDCYEYVEPPMVYTCETLDEYRRGEQWRRLFAAWEPEIKHQLTAQRNMITLLSKPSPVSDDGTVTYPIVKDHP